jgi:hypothetical protein
LVLGAIRKWIQKAPDTKHFETFKGRAEKDGRRWHEVFVTEEEGSYRLRFAITACDQNTISMPCPYPQCGSSKAAHVASLSVRRSGGTLALQADSFFRHFSDVDHVSDFSFRLLVILFSSLLFLRALRLPRFLCAHPGRHFWYASAILLPGERAGTGCVELG